jgi:hypothetical protein
MSPATVPWSSGRFIICRQTVVTTRRRVTSRILRSGQRCGRGERHRDRVPRSGWTATGFALAGMRSASRSSMKRRALLHSTVCPAPYPRGFESRAQAAHDRLSGRPQS